MRTLALLAALLLLALQAQAQPPTSSPDDEEQLGKKDQVPTITFTKEVRRAIREAGVRQASACYCRPKCLSNEVSFGGCHIIIQSLERCCI